MNSFRNFYEFFRAGTADGTNKIFRKLFGFEGEDTVVAGVFLHRQSSGLAVVAQTGEGQLAGFHMAAGAGFRVSAQFNGNSDLVQI